MHERSRGGSFLKGVYHRVRGWSGGKGLGPQPGLQVDFGCRPRLPRLWGRAKAHLAVQARLTLLRWELGWFLPQPQGSGQGCGTAQGMRPL